MADGQQYDTSQLDEVQHPTLGPLKFPHAMPFDERNRIIGEMEAKKGGTTQAGAASLQPGAIQLRKGGAIFKNAAEALKSQQEVDQGVYSTLSQATGLSPQPKLFSKGWWKNAGLNLGLDVADTLPAAGATVGAIAGFPEGGPVGSVGGAGIGGMGGEAGKQLMYRALGWGGPKTTDEAARRIVREGITQGAVQGATEGMSTAAGPIIRAASRQYERALAPTTKINKTITQEITPELIKRGERGSLPGLEKRASEEIATLKPKLTAAYSATPDAAVAGSGSKIIQDLESLKGKYVVNGQSANPAAVDAISGVQQVVRETTQRPGPDVSAESLRQLKAIFDEPVGARGGYAGGDLTTAYTLKAQKAAANSIRDIMGKANPDVAALNKEISFWLDVQRVTRQSGLRKTGQEGGLVRALNPLAMGAAGAVTGAHFGMTEGIEAGGTMALATLAFQMVRSPAWRTTSAVAKDRLANALARGSVGEVTAFAARFGLAADQASSRQENQSSKIRRP